MIEAYVDAFKRYADFRGRTSRANFWWFSLASLIVGLIIVGGLAFSAPPLSLVFEAVYIAYLLAQLIPGIAITVRRLHDINRSGWWYLVALVPLIGIVVWYWCAQPSAPANKWGPGAATPVLATL